MMSGRIEYYMCCSSSCCKPPTMMVLVQGRTPVDVSDPDVETLLEELKKQQELVRRASF